jgi:hypothetical protein
VGGLSLSVPRLWLGREEAPVPPRRFTVGSLTLDVDGVDVRGISLADRELVNRIYVSVRDTDWNTLPPTVSDLAVREEPDTTMEITFQARHAGAGISFSWQGTVRSTPDGALSYLMDGVADGDFRYNRIGICVLHPSSLAGRPYRAMTEDGDVRGTLPQLIAPQSIVDGHERPLFPAFSALAIEVDEGLTVRHAFEGDLFEMEDQRNWTDGSFKTYCTPIALGYPHDAVRGQRFRQRVVVSPNDGRGSAPPGGPTERPDRSRATSTVRGRDARSTSGQRIALELGGVSGGAWPQLGLGSAVGGAARPLSEADVRLLRELQLDHLRFDLRLSDPAWATGLERAVANARAIGARLEVALFVGDAALDDLRTAATRLRDPIVARVIALYEPTAGVAATPAAWLDRVADAISDDRGGGPDIVSGTDGDFAELNRDRPEPGPAVGLAYAINPQVHAFDEISIVETLPIHGDTVRTARSFAPGRRVIVSPVTLRQRFNPAAADPATASASEPSVDERQPSLFAAGWLLGSLASFARAGADSVTYFETVGPRGVLGPAGLDHGGSFAIPAGTPLPTWFVLADLADRSGWNPVALDPGLGPTITGHAMRRADDVRVLVANVTPNRVTVVTGPFEGDSADVRSLDAGTAVAAMTAPARFRASADPIAVVGERVEIRLEPFAYVRIDGAAGDRTSSR